MNDTIAKMTTLKDAVPDAFDKAKQNYIKEIDNSKSSLEKEFQNTLNGGFKQVYLTVTIASLIALIVLAFYKSSKDKTFKNK